MRTRLVAMSKDLMTEAWDPSRLVAGGKQVANWSLKAIHELAFLVDRSTPFALGALNILSKVVGGFYVLLAMIWRDVRKPKPPPTAVPPSLQGPSSSLPPPRPLQHIPSQVRQRPPSAHAAMDTMYSQSLPPLLPLLPCKALLPLFHHQDLSNTYPAKYASVPPLPMQPWTLCTARDEPGDSCHPSKCHDCDIIMGQPWQWKPNQFRGCFT